MPVAIAGPNLTSTLKAIILGYPETSRTYLS
jgi:hypothetical protein